MSETPVARRTSSDGTRPNGADPGVGPDADVQRRSDREFEAFFNTYFTVVLRRVQLLNHDRAAAEDICADVFTLAHRRFSQLRSLEEPQLRAWLYRTGDLIGKNYRRSAIRYRRLIASLERQPLQTPPTPDDLLASAEQHRQSGLNAERARSVLAALDPKHRAPIELAEYNRRSGPDIARQLGISHQAARLRLMRARRAFGDEYRHRFGTTDPGSDR